MPFATAGLSATVLAVTGAGTNPSAYKVQLGWSDVGGTGVEYTLYRAEGDGAAGSIYSGTDIAAYEDEAVQPGKAYSYYVVASRGVDRASEPSNTVAVEIPTVAAAVVTDLEAEGGDKRITLTWSGGSNATGYHIYRKNAERDTSGVAGAATGEWVLHDTVEGEHNQTYVDEDLPDGTRYYYYVTAVRNDVERVETTITDDTAVTAPASPRIVDAEYFPGVAGAVGSIKLTWQRVPGVSEYEVIRNGVTIENAGAGMTVGDAVVTYIDSNLAAGRTYSYTILAVNYDDPTVPDGRHESRGPGRNLAVSDVEVAVPAEAQEFDEGDLPVTITVEHDTITVAWDPVVDGNNDPAAYYKLYRTGTATVSGVDPIVVLSETSFTDHEFTLSSSYFYTVEAYDSSGILITSGFGEITTYPLSPDDLTASDDSDWSPEEKAAFALGQLWTEVSWKTMSGLTYQLFRNGILVGEVSGTGSSVTVHDCGDSDLTDSDRDTSAEVVGDTLDPGTTYTYTVKAIDADGRESILSVPAAATTLAKPEPPRNVTIVEYVEWGAQGIPRGIHERWLVWSETPDSRSSVWRDGTELAFSDYWWYEGDPFDPEGITVMASNAAGSSAPVEIEDTWTAPDDIAPIGVFTIPEECDCVDLPWMPGYTYSILADITVNSDNTSEGGSGSDGLYGYRLDDFVEDEGSGMFMAVGDTYTPGRTFVDTGSDQYEWGYGYWYSYYGSCWNLSGEVSASGSVAMVGNTEIEAVSPGRGTVSYTVNLSCVGGHVSVGPLTDSAVVTVVGLTVTVPEGIEVNAGNADGDRWLNKDDGLDADQIQGNSDDDAGEVSFPRMMIDVEGVSESDCLYRITPSSNIRLWTNPDGGTRSMATIRAGGTLVSSSETYTWNEIQALYVEATGTGYANVHVEVDPDGDGPCGFIVEASSNEDGQGYGFEVGAYSGTSQQDGYEHVVIEANNEDIDSDGIVDWADGYDGDGSSVGDAAKDDSIDGDTSGKFFSFTVSRDESIDLADEKIRFTYSQADTVSGPRVSSPVGFVEYELPSSGELRVWMNTGASRTDSDLIAGNKTEYSASTLGWSAGGTSSSTFEIEAIKSTPGSTLLVERWDPDAGESGEWVVERNFMVHGFDADLDIDSDNAGGLEHSETEDQNESSATGYVRTGKLIDVNSGDVDGDGIVDWADGYNWDGIGDSTESKSRDDSYATDDVGGIRLVPITVSLPTGVPLGSGGKAAQHNVNLTLTLNYDESDPAEIVLPAFSMDGVYELPTGGTLRLWSGPSVMTSDYERSARRFDSTDARANGETGYFVPKGTYGWEDLQKLGFSEKTRTITLWAEGIARTSGTETVTLDFHWSAVDADHVLHSCSSSDEILLTVRATGDLDIDSDNSNVGDPDRSDYEEYLEDAAGRPGKIIYVNDGDVDEDGLIGFADLEDTTGTKPQFVPIVLQLPGELGSDAKFYSFDYSFSDPASVDIQVIGEDRIYTPAAGGNLRIWKSWGCAPRRAAPMKCLQRGATWSSPAWHTRHRSWAWLAVW